MYRFPEGVFSDVRLEESVTTVIAFVMGRLEQRRERTERTAFIRVFDGIRWYFSSLTDPRQSKVQEKLDDLAAMASVGGVSGHPVLERLSRQRGERLSGRPDGTVESKTATLESYFGELKAFPQIASWQGYIGDGYSRKRIVSSLGADISFDRFNCGIGIGFSMADGESRASEQFMKTGLFPGDLEGCQDGLRARLQKTLDYLGSAVDVVAGGHTVVLSPLAAGIFAHESFGHKSEADFMTGDETMLREWPLGARVGPDILSIWDDGTVPGTGFTPFDDEGTPGGRTFLVKNGVLSGRLHSAITAAELREAPTGNARAVSFNYEPIPRMTTTCIEPGDISKKDLFGGIEDGIFVETVKHGSGMSTFTIAPNLAYRIRGGEIGEPLKVSVITGNVMETLGEIDGLSREWEVLGFVGGGCGKMEQYPLPVGFGGPFVRVRRMQVN
jgi:TldD protein